jgi:hypothetical protein
VLVCGSYFLSASTDKEKVSVCYYVGTWSHSNANRVGFFGVG